MINTRYVVFLLIITVACLKPMAAHSFPDTVRYKKVEVMIRMRDGIKLFTRIYKPLNVKEKLPVLMMRSPYSAWNIGVQSPEKDPYIQNMAVEGYFFVYQYIRGKHKSEGEFIMTRPTIVKNDGSKVDESTDTYDTIEWLLKNLEGTNGKFGQLGISYPGWTTLVSAGNPHPAMKAVSDQATMSDLFIGDDVHHNGAFRLSQSFEYAFREEIAKKDTSFIFPKHDLYDWYLKLGPLSNVNSKYFFGHIPSWNNYVEHPSYDSFWQSQSPLSYISGTKIPTLHVGGVWDQEDIMGPQLMYAHMEKRDKDSLNYILLGPWNHAQWANATVTSIGNYEMGRNTAADFQQKQKHWFDYWLKGIGQKDFPEAEIFQTGSNTWHAYKTWPPKNAEAKKLYTHNDGTLTFKKPEQKRNVFNEYISDPAKPIPYRARPIEPTYGLDTHWWDWLTEDQRFAQSRPDVLSWESEVLTEDQSLTGSIIAHLFASTTGTDADWVVKLIDVYPDNCPAKPKMADYELMVASEVFRGRFYKSFSKPEALEPGKVNEFVIDLHQIDHVFLKGHKIMVQVQSSWFPIIDRNPQTFVPNIYKAKETDFKKAIHRVYSSENFSTYIEFPVVK
jgi:putative CocE/NonD family hydrolase